MPVIDSDAHVDETEDTWMFMDEDEVQYRPATGYPSNPDPKLPPSRYWVIDGRRNIRFIRNDEGTRTTVETRELMDVDARLRDMDRMGVDFQVIYPTLFLVENTDKPEVQSAIRRSYNRWLADRWAKSGGRLRWVMLPPTLDIPKAVEEVRFAKDHGAAGILKKGDKETGHWVDEDYFFPLYEEAQKHDLPLCFHTGSGTPDYTSTRNFSSSSFYRISLPPVHAFQSLITHDIPGKFPMLRFGFIEATASWLPFVLYKLRRTIARRDIRGDSVLRGPTGYSISDDVLKKNRMFISCQVDEDLPYLLKFAGEDSLMMGSDYTHNDDAMEMDYVPLLQERADRGEIPQSAVKKITEDNPKAFYGIS